MKTCAKLTAHASLFVKAVAAPFQHAPRRARLNGPDPAVASKPSVMSIEKRTVNG